MIRKLKRSLQGRRARLRQAAIALLTLFVSLIHTDTSMATPCANGASPPKAEWCDFFVEYVPRGQRPIDPRISVPFGPPAPGDPEIRSFAFVVSVSSYDNLIDPKSKDLVGVRNDLPNIISFLKEQQFDEIIVLKEDKVTPQTIRDIFDQYLFRQIKANQKRSRFLFAYDGHGARSLDPSLAGGLALSSILGDGDIDPNNSFSLEELALKLKTLATFSYQSLALLGSCYSGGALFPERSPNSSTTYSLSPGAHVVAAAGPDELAISYPDGHGTVFFDAIIRAVRQYKQPDHTSIIDTSTETVVKNNAIVRLGDVVNAINEALEEVPSRPYPQLGISEMAPRKNFGGAFFFLVNRSPTVTVVADATNNGAPKDVFDVKSVAAIAKTTSELIATDIVKTASVEGGTGSSIVGKPTVAIFNVPEAYRIRGVDLSRFNDNVDFGLLRQNDIRFAYLRATQGAGQTDRTFNSYREQAAKAGILTGAYHVFSFCEPVAAQMANLKKVIPVDANALPIAIDIEWYGSPALPGEASCKAVSDIRAKLRDFATQIRSYSGKTPILYAGTQAIRELLDDSFNQYSIWIASYSASVANKVLPSKSSNPWTLWQFTDQAQIPGIKGKFDLNAFFGNEVQFEAFKSGKGNVALNATVAIQ
jgi:GH25 family lysozyme M1 (1,4-beta-N-acetylmuramidase)